MINSRNKGNSGEREIAKLLHDHLGIKLQRNLEQCRSGGSDLTPEQGSLLDGYSLEIKRYASVSTAQLKTFWKQTCEQATAAYKTPILLFRQDRGEWLAVIPLYVINNQLSQSHDFQSVAILGLPAFCQVVREAA